MVTENELKSWVGELMTVSLTLSNFVSTKIHGVLCVSPKGLFYITNGTQSDIFFRAQKVRSILPLEKTIIIQGD